LIDNNGEHKLSRYMRSET